MLSWSEGKHRIHNCQRTKGGAREKLMPLSYQMSAALKRRGLDVERALWPCLEDDGFPLRLDPGGSDVRRPVFSWWTANCSELLSDPLFIRLMRYAKGRRYGMGKSYPPICLHTSSHYLVNRLEDDMDRVDDAPICSPRSHCMRASPAPTSGSGSIASGYYSFMS